MSITKTVVGRPTTMVIAFILLVGLGIYSALDLAIDAGRDIDGMGGEHRPHPFRVIGFEGRVIAPEQRHGFQAHVPISPMMRTQLRMPRR